MTQSLIEQEVGALLKWSSLYIKGNNAKVFGQLLKQSLTRIAAASREEGLREGNSGRLMYQRGKDEGFAAAIEAVREKLPEAEPDINLQPGFNITAEYRLGEIRGRNMRLEEILITLDTITSPTKQ